MNEEDTHTVNDMTKWLTCCCGRLVITRCYCFTPSATVSRTLVCRPSPPAYSFLFDYRSQFLESQLVLSPLKEPKFYQTTCQLYMPTIMEVSEKGRHNEKPVCDGWVSNRQESLISTFSLAASIGYYPTSTGASFVCSFADYVCWMCVWRRTRE